MNRRGDDFEERRMEDVVEDFGPADDCDLQELRIIPALDPTS